VQQKCKYCVYMSNEPIDKDHKILKKWYRCLFNPQYPMSVVPDAHCRDNFKAKAESKEARS